MMEHLSRHLFFLLVSLAALQQVNGCYTWYDDCSGEYFCLSDNSNPPAISCITINIIPQSLVPPPGICTNETLSGECQFINPCKAWNKGCYGVDYQCTLESEYIEYNETHPPCPLYHSIPPAKEQCVYTNNTCQWFNGCAMWPGRCNTTGYQCGTLAEKYRHSFDPVLPCPLAPRPLPPGDCIYQTSNCTWSNCRSWLDWCRTFWTCGNEFDYEAYWTTPPPPCPAPPQNYTPPAEPGVCQYNLTVSGCHYDQPVNPCATIRCARGSVCKVYAPTGQGYCEPSCDIANGGCNSTQTCSLVPVQCITAPCPPVVKCTDDPCATVRCSSRCIANDTQAICLPSCYTNNGGCEEICTVAINSPCSGQQPSCSYTTCSKSNDYLNGDCPTGQVLRSCGTACQRTCFNYNQSIPCILICVIDQCECPTGLVKYRERCVDPLECPSLLQSPPPLNPLPMPSDTLLIQFIASNLTLQDYNQLRESRFKSDIRNYLIAGGVTTPTITTYDIITNKSDLYILLTIKSDSIPSDISPDQVVNILQAQIDSLPVNISYITRVTSGSSDDDDNNGLSAGVIAAIVDAVVSVVVVSIALVVIVTVAILVILRVRKRRAQAVDQKKSSSAATKEVYVTLTEDDEND